MLVLLGNYWKCRLKEGKWEIKIVALRRVRRGEEITFDYQKELINLLDKESMPGIHALNLKSMEDVKRSREFSLCYHGGGEWFNREYRELQQEKEEEKEEKEEEKEEKEEEKEKEKEEEKLSL
eukprot:g14224.t1